MMPEHVDALIIGAGISGISAAYYIQTRCPNRTYAILEARAALGGTWDVFRYPGVRSDSDMTTFGYSFRPWDRPRTVASGDELLEYLRDTATRHGIDARIRFRHRVTRASWCSKDARWTVAVESEQNASSLTCNFLFFCCGYFDFERPYVPRFPGMQRFEGRIVHPQDWSDDVPYSGKRVIVIGSGSTAVTLVPELSRKASHVVMLQRSPGYVRSRAVRDPTADRIRRHLPPRIAFEIIRWRNLLFTLRDYRRCQRHPERAREEILSQLRKAFTSDYVDAHLTPRYAPWDQRPAVILDGDLLVAIREGRTSLVTDDIETFTETGIRLRSGDELPADLIVTATGSDLQVLGGTEIVVDGDDVDIPKRLTYRGMMYDGVPNLAFSIGYTNASWTLKVELVCRYVCRLLQHMEKRGIRRCVPRSRDPSITPEPWTALRSGYIARAREKFASEGSKYPWKLFHNYPLDLIALRFAPIEDGVLEWSRSHRAVTPNGESGAHDPARDR